MRVAVRLVVWVLCVMPAVAAGNAVVFVPTPTLDDGGLIVLSVLVAAAAGWAVRRNKKK